MTSADGAAAPFDHPVRGRLDAWLLAALDGYQHAELGAVKRRLLAGAPPSSSSSARAPARTCATGRAGRA